MAQTALYAQPSGEETLTAPAKDRDTLTYLALQYLAWNNYAKATSFATEGILSFPSQNEYFYYLRAKAYEATENFSPAIVDYEQYLAFLKKKLSVDIRDYREETVAEDVSRLTNIYYRLFLLYAIAETGVPKGIMAEYKDFLQGKGKEAIQEQAASLSAALRKLSALTPLIEERIKETGPSNLKAYVANTVLEELGRLSEDVMRQNETIAVFNLIRTGVAARRAYALRKRYPDTLNEFFFNAEIGKLLDVRLFSKAKHARINGYEFLYSSTGQGFACIAVPVIPDRTGERSFIVTESFTVVEDVNNNAAVDKDDILVVDLTLP